MGDEYVFCMLDHAIDLLSEAQLFKLVKQHLDPSTLGPDGHEQGNVLADVRAFEKASLGGEYYQDFSVNSKNYMEKSTGACTRLTMLVPPVNRRVVRLRPLRSKRRASVRPRRSAQREGG